MRFLVRYNTDARGLFLKRSQSVKVTLYGYFCSAERADRTIVTENKCLLRLCHIDPRQERMSASARQWKPDLEAQALYWELARVAGASST